MAYKEFPLDPSNPDPTADMRSFFGPGQVDQIVRQAIQTCWMSLPPDKKNAAELERQFRRIVDRALRDLKEDEEQFK